MATAEFSKFDGIFSAALSPQHHLSGFSSLLCVIHTVKGFGIVNKAEPDIFLELPCFFDDPEDVVNLSLVPLPFLKPAWPSGSSRFTYC